MGLCNSRARVNVYTENNRSSKIDTDLKAESKKQNHEIKLLLLGAGEGGKSTFAKQMKILHLKGFTDKERRHYALCIRQQVIQNASDLMGGMKMLGFPLTPPEYQIQMSEMIGEMVSTSVLTEACSKQLIEMWAHPCAKLAWSLRSKYQIADSANYFFTNLNRVGSPLYSPTNEDILWCRVCSTGISETIFTVDDINFRLVDVGGQRNERKKWIHCFDNVESVIFVASLSEFDQLLREDCETNRMLESIAVFADVCQSRFFQNKSIILFLNKRDLFEQKLKEGADLRVCFPDYNGKNTFQDAIEFVKLKYLLRCPLQLENQLVYVHITCATDSGNVAHVFEDIKDSIFQCNLMASGLM
eukprot:c8086_g1_i1.p1 GENE.c8086_g1_i1~~c8086_g1_i1.p1  ORF type:complete len:358 (+),score=62.48 c8086_g1_i1:288-1361(+)